MNRYILSLIISLAAHSVASADIVVFGNDTVVVADTTAVPVSAFDKIIMSMDSIDVPDNQETQESIGTTLDYMSSLFDAGFIGTALPGNSTAKTGGSAGFFTKEKIPEGDIFINVSEFHMPAIGPLTSRFGPRKNRKRIHRGVDVGIAKGDTIRAAFPGSVATTGYDKRGYGYYVILTHPNGLQTLYAHLDHFLVVPTTTVDAGTPIAIGGTSGNSSGPHLHFETRYRALPIDPADIINFRRRKPHASTFIFNKAKLEKE